MKNGFRSIVSVIAMEKFDIFVMTQRGRSSTERGTDKKRDCCVRVCQT